MCIRDSSLPGRLSSNHRFGADYHGAWMNFAREGLLFIVGSAVIAAAVILVAVTKRSWPIWLLGFALLVVAIWVASFFRDPERPGARGDQIVISPADGKVVLVTEVDEPTFMKAVSYTHLRAHETRHEL